MKYLNQFVQRSDVLDSLRRNARQLMRLTADVRRILPGEFDAHVVACVPKKDVVVVFVDSAAWATQMRYAQREILYACRDALGEHVRQLHFKILPADPPRAKHPVDGPSESARRLLQATAETIDDAELSEALRKLGRKTGQDAD